MDIYVDLGVTPVINAAGTLTRLSGSVMLPEVAEAMAGAARDFVDMHELHLAAGRRIAHLIGVGAAHVCACAAAGIALMAAACMTGQDRDRILRLPDTTGMKCRFPVQKAHRNAFDQALRLAGGEFVEVGPDPDELRAAIDGTTAAVFHTLSWFCTEEALPLNRVAGIAHRAGVPVIVDAAAEIPPVENLTRFLKEGADLVTFSGGKALRGPQASGFILGREDLIEACRLNDSPHMGVGRPMKAGKEEIVGLVKAIECYVNRNHAAEKAVWEQRVIYILAALSILEGVKVRRQLPFGVGQQIPHVALRWDQGKLGITCEGLVQKLLDGRPRIAVQYITSEVYRFARSRGSEIRIHPHTLREGEEIAVVGRIREVFEQHHKEN